MLNFPHSEMEVFCKSVAFKNLSAASQQVGLSQPQLSRVIAKLEEALGVALLDRSSRRHSSWTPVALQVAATYQSANKRLQSELSGLVAELEFSTVKFGILEGLVELVKPLVEKLFSLPGLHSIHVDIFDLNDLDRAFLEDQIDLALTCREPGRKKYRYVQDFGFQTLSHQGTKSKIRILSEYDALSHRERQQDAKLLISNSLMLRRLWIEGGIGSGELPSPVYKEKPRVLANSGTRIEPVILLAQDRLPSKMWEKLTGK